MEQMLLKLARQLDTLDEASLMELWSKYATITSRFEPTQRWEDSCLVFSLIQAKHWKNQLFNYNWGLQRQPPENLDELEMETDFDLLENETPTQENSSGCRILTFRPNPEAPKN